MTLKAKLAALQLHWSTKKPTVPGWYWWRGFTSKSLTMLHVYGGITGDTGQSGLFVEHQNIDSIHGEWAGPLVPPEEAT